MVVLYIENPQGTVEKKEFELDEVTIGRDPGNTIVLPERNISRHHLRIYWENNQWMLADAGSRYGVDYRDEPLTEPQPLVPNAYITIGDYRIKLLSASGMKTDKPSPETTEEQKTPDWQKQTTEEFLPQQPFQGDELEELDEAEAWDEGHPERSKNGIIIVLGVALVVVSIGFLFLLLRGNGNKAQDNANPGHKSPRLAANTPVVKHRAPAGPVAPQAQARAADDNKAAGVKPAQKDVPAQDRAKTADDTKKTVKAGQVQAVKDAEQRHGTDTKPAAKPKSSPVKLAQNGSKRHENKAPVPQEPVQKKVIRKTRKLAMVRRVKRPRTHARAKKRPEKKARKKEQASNSGNEVRAMIDLARHSSGSARLKVLNQCLGKYGNRCCIAHKYIASYYQGQANIKQAIGQWQKYKSCTHNAAEKSRAERMIDRLNGL